MDKVQEQILSLVMKQEDAASNPMRYVREAVKGYALDILKFHLCDCNRCGHKCKTVTKPTGDADAPLLCIMDCPTPEQAKLDGDIDMFDGDESTKALLAHCFSDLHVDMNKILFMNTVSCCPSRTVPKADGTTEEIYRTPFRHEIEECSTYVKYAIECMYPPMMLIMGNIASNVFLKEPISKVRGKWINYYGIKAKITYSPHEVLDARGQISNEDWIQMGTEFRQDIKDAITAYQRQWPDSILFN